MSPKKTKKEEDKEMNSSVLKEIPTITPPNICTCGKNGCEPLGKRCAGEKRGSCLGWVCMAHVQIGTQSPFMKKSLCQVCFTRQYGTLIDESGKGRKSA